MKMTTVLISRIIYTTNAIESVNSVIRKSIKNRFAIDYDGRYSVISNKLFWSFKLISSAHSIINCDSVACSKCLSFM
ncbi:hypothetical protein EXM22_09705 [Oceanispirochaeta crateris]|uniref:Uncharacterized protein n=1 Tax=Oceanispirochaeta crateris TaxID=2518645 RepID=A0A5C1QLP5_9SPIO|nr:hypothetical protein EXM22_09705 [Oceanispirochaeta crateris]